MKFIQFFCLSLIFLVDKKRLRTNVDKLWTIKCHINFVKIRGTNFTDLKLIKSINSIIAKH